MQNRIAPNSCTSPIHFKELLTALSQVIARFYQSHGAILNYVSTSTSSKLTFVCVALLFKKPTILTSICCVVKGISELWLCVISSKYHSQFMIHRYMKKPPNHGSSRCPTTALRRARASWESAPTRTRWQYRS